jgi:hypothetical protein
MKNMGIWLDKEKAYILVLENGAESMVTIQSNIENFRIHGGSGTRLKGGPQDVVQDSKYLEREKHQTKRYFTEIIELVKDADKLMIFGPADIDKKLKKELELFHKSLDKKVILVEKADSMTLNQTKALIRDAFSRLVTK